MNNKYSTPVVEINRIDSSDILTESGFFGDEHDLLGLKDLNP